MVPGSGLDYTNSRVANVPWSIHVVRVERSNPQFEIRTVHAGGGAFGLSKLTEQISLAGVETAVPVAAINGDFYTREGPYAGQPRGLQIFNGQVATSPVAGTCFWIDSVGEPHATNVSSLFQVFWPNGASSSFAVNEDRPPNGIEVYTRAAGTSTHTKGGRELILEKEGGKSWPGLQPGETYQARVRAARETGDTKIEPETIVLSIGPALTGSIGNLPTGAVITLSMASLPSLRGARAAIGGGPILLQNGKKQKMAQGNSDSYMFSSMSERHPRTAIGWNRIYFFLIEVDGRQKGLSVGMTLDELSDYCLKLGCENAMNLDGGGSATLWFNGRVQNSPCDGRERAIANALVVVRKPGSGQPSGSAVLPSQ